MFTFSKVCFKFCDQASMIYRYPHVASVRLLFFVSIHSYYRDQRRSDCRLVMLYKVTYDLVAIPASDYLTPNRRQSRHIHTDRYPHSRTTISTPSFPEQSYIGMPSQPSYHCFLPWHSLVMLCAR